MRFARLACAVLSGFAGMVASLDAAWAYRPFDSTDPAVAPNGDFEIEFSPLSFRHDDSGKTWIVPQLRLNYGFADDWEVVLEGQGEHSNAAGSALVENALSLKHVLREGSLQDKDVLSIATEFGVLLPGANAEPGAGVSLAGIAGQKFGWGAIHVNVAAELSRDRRGELFLGAILEGPGTWKVRPVAEIVYDRELGLKEEIAALAGVIWEVKDGFAVDFAVRHAGVNGQPETEVRAGITFDFSID
jgi:hypothetical protein